MKFNKLKKIYRILFPIKVTDDVLFEHTMKSNEVTEKVSASEDGSYLITLKNNSEVVVRNSEHSDYDVFKQVYNYEEYKSVLSILNLNETSASEEPVFIDAGANVGYTTVYFCTHFKFSKVFCIEPSVENVRVLEKNIALLNGSESITVLNNALCGKEGLKFDIETDFRDGKDWSITTNEIESGSISGVTINQIIQENQIKQITLLKIDIEGAERFIFDVHNDLSFLNVTKVIAVEIHDEFDIRESINAILRKNNFVLFESGELTIGINTKLVSNL